MAKVIVAGGRKFVGGTLDTSVLDELRKARWQIFELVCGMAKGADEFGRQWALRRGYVVHEFPADWDNLGKRAGILRNVQMADFADALIAFPGGTGTAHMINEMRFRKKPIYMVERQVVETQPLAGTPFTKGANVLPQSV